MSPVLPTQRCSCIVHYLFCIVLPAATVLWGKAAHWRWGSVPISLPELTMLSCHQSPQMDPQTEMETSMYMYTVMYTCMHSYIVAVQSYCTCIWCMYMAVLCNCYAIVKACLQFVYSFICGCSLVCQVWCQSPGHLSGGREQMSTVAGVISHWAESAPGVLCQHTVDCQQDGQTARYIVHVHTFLSLSLYMYMCIFIFMHCTCV